MGMFKKQVPKLGPEDIEVKVKQCTEKGAVALLYKTARTDMRVLDDCVGPENWQDTYHEIKGNLYCTISIYNPETGEWVGKSDCGIESREDDEGNQKKGEASDAFKRAGFKWGIGRELYTAPFIFLSIETQKNSKGKYELKNRFARFSVKSIEYEGDSIKTVVIVDGKGQQVFPRTWDNGGQDRKEERAHHPLVCDVCGKAITPFMYQGNTLTAQEAADRFGKCIVCIREQLTKNQAG